MTGKRFRFRLPRRSRATISAQVDAELQFHLETRTQELVAAGMPPTDARLEAEREFGDLERTRAYCRTQDQGAERAERQRDRFDELVGNVRYATRSLRHSPGFTAVVITTLALAIGANTAIFSVANAILIAPLPYGDPGRVVAIFENKVNASARSDMSAADLVDYAALQKTLTGIGIVGRNGVALRIGDGDPAGLQVARVSANMFEVLAARPARGRTFAPGEDGATTAKVAVLTWKTWMRLFGGDTAAIGATVTINDVPHQVIGVMPAGFGLGYAEDIYLPLDLTPTLADANRSRKMHWLYAVGRLKPGVTLDVARADLNAAARALESKYPDENTGHYVTVLPMQTALAGHAARATWILVGAATLVLLVAGANLTNMTLARATSRRHEMMVRAAIGAERAHLVRQMVTESVVLALLGGVAGTAFALVATRVIVRVAATALPVLAVPTVDWRVLTYAAGISMLLGVVVGLIPALRISHGNMGGALKESGRTSAGDRRGDTLRAALVVAQTAIAVVLLAVAGLLVRSIDAIRNTSLGFEPEHALVAMAFVRGPRYQSRTALNTFYDAVLEKLRVTPGIAAAGASSGIPLLNSSGCGLVIEGEPAPAPGQFKEVQCASARGDYFKALGVPVVRGRAFDSSDLPDGPQVVVVNAAFARRYFANDTPLGKRIRLGPNPTAPWETIVGVVGDTRQNDLVSEPEPTVTEYDAQHGWGSIGMVVRTVGEPLRMVPAVRAAVRAADPSVAVRSVRTMEDVIGLQLSARRFSLTLIASFAVLALVLAAVGTYGVLAYAVTVRTREFGIRMALGASAHAVRESILRRGLAWCGAGLAIGGVAAVVTARALRTMLYGVEPADPLTLALVGAVLFAVTLLACFIPARRAVRVDPIIAMRAE